MYPARGCQGRGHVCSRHCLTQGDRLGCARHHPILTAGIATSAAAAAGAVGAGVAGGAFVDAAVVVVIAVSEGVHTYCGAVGCVLQRKNPWREAVSQSCVVAPTVSLFRLRSRCGK